jgi:prevent-host-death family protein
MFVLTTNVKGAIAEAEIFAAAVRLGVPVYTPVAEHGRADLVLEIGGRFFRVQCKWANLSPDKSVVIVNAATSRRSRAGHIRSTYSEAEIDLFAVYCGELDRCFLIPIDLVAGKSMLYLRVTPPRNSQRSCINLAEDRSFDGAIAQLGERLRGTQEVAGSSPASSTESPEPVTVGVNAFRDGLGVWMDRVAAGEEVILTRHGRPKIRLSPATGHVVPANGCVAPLSER